MTKGVMKRWRLACVLAAVGIAGCAEGAGAPTEAIGVGASARAAVVSTSALGDTIVEKFVLHANQGGDFRIAGEHWIHIPGYAVCDPATSSYGPTQWDAPCEPTKGPIQITTVSYHDANGHPRIDFSPELRFVPAQKKQGWVYLTMGDVAAAGSSSPTILYCGPDGACIDESTVDGTLTTRRSEKLGTVSRRIKHFSGYMVATGRLAEAL